MRWLWYRNKNVIAGQEICLEIESEQRDSVDFRILTVDSHIPVGHCDLRFGMNEELYYAGNIGYRVYEPYRGHGYAYQACQLLFRLAREKYGMSELIITCSPDNIPSLKTLEKLGGVLLETVNVPAWHWLYKRGETVKNIYRFFLL